ncbi:MAG: YafY family transcriptional regulator [Rhodobacteraceae bacterium]|nr:YafY family transcriptional regulator [Paracoccaceae bacterium]
MARPDRLIDLIQILKDGRLHRAEDIAERLKVSPRTVYRDMTTLASSGLPVEGTRGIGYRITAAITLPPLNLSKIELEALHLGLAVVGDARDEELKEAAASLSAKIDAVLPEDRKAAPSGFGFAVYPFADAAFGFQHMPALRGAIRARQKVAITFVSKTSERTDRTIRPLQLDYWGRVWTVTAWCELRSDFRTFRVDKIEALRVLPAIFTEEEGKRLQDFEAR